MASVEKALKRGILKGSACLAALRDGFPDHVAAEAGSNAPFRRSWSFEHAGVSFSYQGRHQGGKKKTCGIDLPTSSTKDIKSAILHPRRTRAIRIADMGSATRLQQQWPEETIAFHA
eukprot:9479617-Pyramimonas_sp.AAC.1